MSKEDDKESKEPDYEEDKDQLEEKQEEERGELTNTTNDTFLSLNLLLFAIYVIRRVNEMLTDNSYHLTNT